MKPKEATTTLATGQVGFSLGDHDGPTGLQSDRSMVELLNKDTNAILKVFADAGTDVGHEAEMSPHDKETTTNNEKTGPCCPQVPNSNSARV